MPRYRLTVEYDGGPYCGLQAQTALPTIQGDIERAIFAFCGETVRLHAAGRTDTGVHATGQVIHIDLTRDWPASVVMRAINAHLAPAPICVLSSEVVSDAFHARFTAVGRRYLYRILNRPSPPALDHGKVWHIKPVLDAARMHDAAQALVGLHDFTTFRDTACQAASPIKTLDHTHVTTSGDEVQITFAARSFLHRQVRSMTGSLVQVGLGRWSVTELSAALDACDRSACGPVAPAQGLYLTGVVYDENAAK